MEKIVNKKGYALSDKFSIAPYNNSLVRILIVKKCSKKVLKELNKLFPQANLDGSELAMVHKHYTGKKELLVMFNADHIYGSPLGADCIAHECVHVKNIIYETIGQELDTEAYKDECEAYLVGYLTHIVFDFFSRTDNLKKIKFEYNEQHY